MALTAGRIKSRGLEAEIVGVILGGGDTDAESDTVGVNDADSDVLDVAEAVAEGEMPYDSERVGVIDELGVRDTERVLVAVDEIEGEMEIETEMDGVREEEREVEGDLETDLVPEVVFEKLLLPLTVLVTVLLLEDVRVAVTAAITFFAALALG